jgi:AcrR family transcriptional regulator
MLAKTDNSAAIERTGPGRPRRVEAEGAILNATLELMALSGLEGLSMDAVAARAGVSKATIYRRWPSRSEMVAAALRCIASDIEVPDTGSIRDDLTTLLRSFQHATLDSLPESLRPRLIALTLTNPGLLEIFLTNVFAPRRSALLNILERGKASGELRPDLDVNQAFITLHGAMLQLALLGEPDAVTDPNTPVKLVDTLLQCIAGRRPNQVP